MMTLVFPLGKKMDALYLEILRIYFNNFPKTKEVCSEAGLRTIKLPATSKQKFSNLQTKWKCFLFSTPCQQAKGHQGGWSGYPGPPFCEQYLFPADSFA